LSVCFNFDGTKLASGGGDYNIKVWNMSNYTEEFNFKGHEGWVLSLSFDPKNTYLASGGGDKTIRIWDLE
jgi:WD40 repeat protein